MINRILIRIKAVQILYSFLLVEKEFALEPVPVQPTKEKRYAYELYLDMLVLLIKVARTIERRRGEYPLRDTRFISRLLLDDQIMTHLDKQSLPGVSTPLDALVAPLSEKIKESGVYKGYLKDLDKNIPNAEENMWHNLFEIVIMPQPELIAVASQRPNYTLKAYERTRDMLVRTVVNFLASNDNISEAVAELEKSLGMARELYFRLLWLPVELTELQDRIIDDNRHKFLKTEEDINPNMRFVENSLITALRTNPAVTGYIDEHKLSWLPENRVMLESLLSTIRQSELYAEYMEGTGHDMQEDCEFWIKVLRRIVFGNTHFLEALEETSVFWNDDLDIIGTFVIKTLKRLEDGMGAAAILDQYKDDEDRRFGAELMQAVYSHRDEYRALITDALATGNWDADRLAFMDIVVMEMALAEILNFPKIPLRVSINEYIEIAKSYSTARSGHFVNGMLASIVNRLREEGRLVKK